MGQGGTFDVFALTLRPEQASYNSPIGCRRQWDRFIDNLNGSPSSSLKYQFTMRLTVADPGIKPGAELSPSDSVATQSWVHSVCLLSINNARNKQLPVGTKSVSFVPSPLEAANSEGRSLYDGWNAMVEALQNIALLADGGETINGDPLPNNIVSIELLPTIPVRSQLPPSFQWVDNVNYTGGHEYFAMGASVEYDATPSPIPLPYGFLNS